MQGWKNPKIFTAYGRNGKNKQNTLFVLKLLLVLPKDLLVMMWGCVDFSSPAIFEDKLYKS